MRMNHLRGAHLRKVCWRGSPRGQHHPVLLPHYWRRVCGMGKEFEKEMGRGRGSGKKEGNERE